MAEGYKVTGQTYGTERQPDGTYMGVVVVRFTTTATPPVAGSVSVPQSLITDKVKFAAAVKSAIEAAVASHSAVAQL